MRPRSSRNRLSGVLRTGAASERGCVNIAHGVPPACAPLTCAAPGWGLQSSASEHAAPSIAGSTMAAAASEGDALRGCARGSWVGVSNTATAETAVAAPRCCAGMRPGLGDSAGPIWSEHAANGAAAGECAAAAGMPAEADVRHRGTHVGELAPKGLQDSASPPW